jgi:hypothetical protein
LLGDLDVQVLGALQVDHRGAFLGEDLEALDAWDERLMSEAISSLARAAPAQWWMP